MFLPFKKKRISPAQGLQPKSAAPSRNVSRMPKSITGSFKDVFLSAIAPTLSNKSRLTYPWRATPKVLDLCATYQFEIPKP